MATINITNDIANIGPLQSLLDTELEPGCDAIGYETCKAIYLWHPLGQKIAETPIEKAQSQARTVTCADSPEDRVVKAFNDQWAADNCDEHIKQLGSAARIYGVASMGCGVRNASGTASAANTPLKPDDFTKDIFFSIWDPLNLAGSMVTDQDPNKPDFLKPSGVQVNGTPWHPSRTVTLMNERPIYLNYVPSAFGYVGRSVYQRAFYPLKSYLSSMIADAMIAQKLGLLIAKRKQTGPIVDEVIKFADRLRRSMLKDGGTGNVLTVGPEDNIETLNMMNVDGAGTYARRNILTDIAIATPMPARWLLEEKLAEGFGEGSEDAKAEASYTDSVRMWLRPAYDFLTPIIQARAWTEEFYKSVQEDFKDWRNVSYEQAIFRWKNSFDTTWPSMLQEPESERVKVDEIRFKTVLSAAEILINAGIDPSNKMRVFQFVQANLNAQKLLITDPLNLDFDAMEEHFEETKEQEAQNQNADTEATLAKAKQPMRLAGR